MKLADLTLQSLELVQGMEKRLLQRRRGASFALGLTAVGIVTEVVLAALNDEKYRANLRALGEFVNKLLVLDFSGLLQGGLPVPELTGALLLIGGLVGYTVMRWTGLLLQESEEPFRYTFQVAGFTAVAGTPEKRMVLGNADRLALLQHDLAERLNQRIKRLSFLDLSGDKKEDLKNRSLTSHIHIDGEYVVREKRDGEWLIQVTARVRIGAPDRPSQLTSPARLELRWAKPRAAETPAPAKPASEPTATDKAVAEKPATGMVAADKPLDTPTCEFSVSEYNHLIELVYSRVATEVYRQIESDIQGKILLFPTAYLRAVALAREAEDFARSNTIDAYDRAIDLYRQALRYFRVADIEPITNLLVRLPLAWRKELGFLHRRAMVITGYAKCLIYRRKLSALTGRYRNPLFEVPPLLKEATAGLERLQQHIVGTVGSGRASHGHAYLAFPRDDWRRALLGRPLEARFGEHRRIYFDALVTSALACTELGAGDLAQQYLDDARALDAARIDRDPLYLLTAGEIEPDLDKQAQWLQQATELAPDFQIAVYRAAFCNEQRLRREGEFTRDKTERVIDDYQRIVQEINPGNIAALAGQGRLYWLLGDAARAEEKFQQGLELKELVQETFVGELNYGLARIAAEKGCYAECYKRYRNATAADPGVAAYTASASDRAAVDYYAYITPAMMARYARYKEGALRDLEALAPGSGTLFVDKEGKQCSRRTLDVVKSFVLNDYGNACFNFYLRHGWPSYLDQAVQAYAAAIGLDAENAVAHYDYARALARQRVSAEEYEKSQETITRHLSRAGTLAPTWPTIHVAATEAEIDYYRRQITDNEKKLADLEKKRSKSATELDALREQIVALQVTRRGAGRATAEDSGRERGSQAMSEERPSASQSSVTGRLGGSYGRAIPVPLGAQDKGADELGRRTREADDKQKELAQYEADIRAVQAVIDQRRNDIEQKGLAGLRRVMVQSRFGPLFDRAGEQINDEGSGIDKVLEVGAGRERVDEQDIRALQLWAQILWQNTSSKTALAAANRLSLLLDEYYPEDFDRTLFMVEAISEIERSGRFDAREVLPNRDAQQLVRLLQNAVRYSIDIDPIHVSTLTWLLDSRTGFGPAGARDVLREETRYDARYQSAGCMQLLGDCHYLLDAWDEAIASLRRAVTLAPEEAGFRNQLGNACFEAKRFEEAVEQYQVIAARPDARAVYHRNLGNALESLNRWEEACAAYRRASEADQAAGSDGATDLARLKWALNSWGNQYYDARQYREAIARYSEAIRVDDREAVIHSNLALAWQSEGTDPRAIDHAIAALRRAAALAPQESEYRDRLQHLDKLRESVRIFGPTVVGRTPAVTPIALEVAADLIPLVARDDDSLVPGFQQAINQLRDALEAEYGVRVPGIRVRGNDSDLADGTYVILLMEVPVVSGHVNLERCLVLADPGALAAEGVDAEPAVDPLTDETASWIERTAAASLPEGKYQILDPARQLARHLQAVLVRNLSDFQGVQETFTRISSECPDRLVPLRQSRHGLVGFSLALKALLAEQVSIAPIAALADGFLAQSAAGVSLPVIVEALRRLPAVHEQLVVNRPQDRRKWLNLAPDFEARLHQSLHTTDGLAVLAMPPEATQAALTAVRGEIGDAAREAIVVADPEIRPHLRSLVELEFPKLSVFARAELTRPPAEGETQVIRLAS